MKVKFIPIDYSGLDFEDKNYVQMVGRNEKGKRICIIDSYEPNFWAILEDGLSNAKIEKIRKKIEKINAEHSGREVRVLRTEVHDKKFLGRDVKAIQVFVTNHKDSYKITDEIKEIKEITHNREKDIPLITKYIKEKNVKPLTWYEIEGDIVDVDGFGGLGRVLEVDLCIQADSIKECKQEEFEPRFLAYDIEVNELELGKGDILMVSLYGKNFKKVITWKKCDIKQDFVECVKDEADMLERFVECVKKYDPDFLVGYFSDGFDLPYLRANAQKNRVKLSLGLDGKQPSFARGRIPSGKMFGIVHLDLFRFIRTAYSQYLKSETLSLGSVASELLGETKHDFDTSKTKNLGEKDWKEFFKYNLQDSALTFKLAEKLWPDLLELCKTVSEPCFNINRAGLSSLVENYIIHSLDRFNEIVEKRPLYDEIGERKAKGKFEGGFVLEPEPGLYEDIAIFDFTSMHTSIIVSFNISKTTLLEKKEKDSYETPEIDFQGNKTKFYFSKEPGFFPLLLKDIFEKRKKMKQEYFKDKNPITKARSNVFKLLSASVHGYQAFFGARYYSFEAASSVLAFVRKFNKDIIEKTNKQGYKSIYADTDSIAFLLNKKSKKQTLDFLKKINSSLPGIMELDLEDFFKRGLFVSKRTTSAGAKKKYALISEDGKIKIRGFETVRRDWCTLARELQKDVLNKILKEGNEKSALEIAKKTIEKIKKRDVDKEKLMIRTQLKKPLNEYIAQGPHVIAARKMEEQGIPVSQGMLIQYFVAETKNGSKKKLVRDKVKLPNEKGKYNIEYYLNNQILPAIENIFEVFDINLKEVIDGEKQKKLF